MRFHPALLVAGCPELCHFIKIVKQDREAVPHRKIGRLYEYIIREIAPPFATEDIYIPS